MPELPLGPKDDLQRMVDHAGKHGAQTAKAKLLSVLAYIEYLEAELDLIAAHRRRAGHARADALTPERRRQIAIQAGRRLKTVASQTEVLPL